MKILTKLIFLVDVSNSVSHQKVFIFRQADARNFSIPESIIVNGRRRMKTTEKFVKVNLKLTWFSS